MIHKFEKKEEEEKKKMQKACRLGPISSNFAKEFANARKLAKDFFLLKFAISLGPFAKYSKMLSKLALCLCLPMQDVKD